MTLLQGYLSASVTLALLAGCAGVARQDDDQLVAAGFVKTRADTPDWLAAMKSLPPHRFVHRTVNGVPMILYADPIGCRCVYTATSDVYAAYRQEHREEVASFDASLSGGGDEGH